MRAFFAVAVGAALAVTLAPAAPAQAKEQHALSLLGKIKYPPDFKHLDYVNPDAPKGGTLRLHSIGGFDSFNSFIAKGNAAGLGFIYQTLMSSPQDEQSTEYGDIARSVEVPDDLSYAIFNLRPEARFHDGKRLTADDVIFSFETLKEKGRPFFRFYYANISKAEKLGSHRVKFHFSGPPNRELPQITGQLFVLPKHYWETRDFSKTTLEPPLGSGPYKVSKFEPGRYLEFERVTDWWAADLPINKGRFNFDTIRVDYYRDQTVALEAFKAGRYDFRSENSAKNWATAYNTPAKEKGELLTEDVAHKRPTGMQAFVFNLRREKFRDRNIRFAMAHAFDFEWSNKNLFYNQYVRTESYFSNSELAATTLPSPEELKLLEPLRDKVPPEVFTKIYQPPATDGSGKVRSNLRKALRLIKQAGWKIEDKKLVDPKTGKPLTFEILLVSPAFERVVLPFQKNLKRLGIEATVRTVDQAQYINRLRDFDFDVIVGGWGQSESPGNEQRDFFSSEAADRPGGRNAAGIKDPAVDALIDRIISAPDRATLVTATRALDRVLLWNHFVIPQWHVRADRVARWNRFGVSKHPDYGIDLMSWWTDPEKAAAIDKGRNR